MVLKEDYVKQLTESEVKYLAGLMDADGSLFFQFVPYNDKYNVRLILVLQQSLSIDRDGVFMKSLLGFGGQLQEIGLAKTNPNWSDALRWSVKSMEQLNMLLPRLTKHMVIKAKHWETLFTTYRNLVGKSVTEQEMLELRELSNISRKDTGPLKDKKHPTWAWVAGYIDGDGCYYKRIRNKNGKKYTEVLVRIVAHTGDVVGLNLLTKAFGGRLDRSSYEETYSWTRNLGPKDYQFAIMFLKKMHRHSRLKRYKIEQLLHYHSQRLSDKTSTEEAIV